MGSVVNRGEVERVVRRLDREVARALNRQRPKRSRPVARERRRGRDRENEIRVGRNGPVGERERVAVLVLEDEAAQCRVARQRRLEGPCHHLLGRRVDIAIVETQNGRGGGIDREQTELLFSERVACQNREVGGRRARVGAIDRDRAVERQIFATRRQTRRVRHLEDGTLLADERGGDRAIEDERA